MVLLGGNVSILSHDICKLIIGIMIPVIWHTIPVIWHTLSYDRYIPGIFQVYTVCRNMSGIYKVYTIIKNFLRFPDVADVFFANFCTTSMLGIENLKGSGSPCLDPPQRAIPDSDPLSQADHWWSDPHPPGYQLSSLISIGPRAVKHEGFRLISEM